MSQLGAPWPAPAKLNLMLRIVGRREDGYHELQTVFQFLDICDQLSFALRQDGLVRRVNEVPGLPPEQDLVVRAAHLLQQATGCGQGIDIALSKRLPMGGGLGGGSSDAATTLVALNHLWRTGLERNDLMALGLQLGADVPVFVFGHAAWAEGVGERMTAIEPAEPWYLVVRPDCHVVTAEVFQDPELTRNSPPIKIRDFLAGADGNDCLPVVAKHYPAVRDALDWLGRFAEAKLTGTGACVYAAFEDEIQARAPLTQLPSGWQAFVSEGRNQSPLAARLRQAAGSK